MRVEGIEVTKDDLVLLKERIGGTAALGVLDRLFVEKGRFYENILHSPGEPIERLRFAQGALEALGVTARSIYMLCRHEIVEDAPVDDGVEDVAVEDLTY